MNKKVVWTIVIAIVIVLLIVLVTTNKKTNEGPNTGNQGNELPETNQADYNNLATSTGDFAALDQAANQLG